jgi:hypothetical protein
MSSCAQDAAKKADNGGKKRGRKAGPATNNKRQRKVSSFAFDLNPIAGDTRDKRAQAVRPLHSLLFFCLANTPHSAVIACILTPP